MGGRARGRGRCRVPGCRRWTDARWRAGRRRARRAAVPDEAGVPDAPVGVEDLEVRAASGRPVAVALDRDGAPSPHDVPAQPDPARGVELQPQAARLLTAAARPRPSDSGSSTTSSAPDRRASAASRPSRSPTRFPATAGSRPSGRSTTSRSTVRAARSEPAIASASSRSAGMSTTSHSGRMPRATASTGSKERARSSHATMAPPAWASAATRSASVVLPELALAPQRDGRRARQPAGPEDRVQGGEPRGHDAPVGVLRGGAAARRRGRERAGSGDRVEAGSASSSGASRGWTARASAPSVSHAGPRPRPQAELATPPRSCPAPASLERRECLGNVG